MSEADEKTQNNPTIVMRDESTGEKYARAVGNKGMGQDKEQDWLVIDMAAELKSWGHPGGAGSEIIMKSDGGSAIVAVREALAKYIGGRVIPEAPAKGESQSNGAVEEAGKTVREFVRVYKEQLVDKTSVDIEVHSIMDD